MLSVFLVFDSIQVLRFNTPGHRRATNDRAHNSNAGYRTEEISGFF
jgi:hypothetical protein